MSKKVKMNKENRDLNEMVSKALFKPETPSFICFICEHALIHPVSAQCNHVFCNYCIALWKKHNQYCPICMEKMGELQPALEINAEIEEFFRTADPMARRERNIVLASREESERDAYHKLKDFIPIVDLSKPKRRFPAPTPRTAASVPKAQGQLGKLLNDTQRLERELDGVYTKILTVGSNLNAREDNLMMTKYGAGAMLQGANTPQSRPSTAPGPKTPRRKPSLAHFESKKPTKAVSEIDDLLELTEDVLKIEDFIHRYSFDRILDDDTPVTSDDVSEFEQTNSDVMERLDAISVVKSGEVRSGQAGGFRIHPEVQAFIDKHCVSKIVPCVPGTAPNVPEIGTSAKDVKSRQNLAATIIREISAVNTLYEGTDRPPTALPSVRLSQSDLTGEVIKCRETLLNLKTKTESQAQGFNIASNNYEPTALKPKPSSHSIISSRSCANVKLPTVSAAAKKMTAAPISNAKSLVKSKNSISVESHPKKESIGTVGQSGDHLNKIIETGESYADKFFTQVDKEILKEEAAGKSKRKTTQTRAKNMKGAMGDCASSSTGGETSESNETLRKARTGKSVVRVETISGSTRPRSRAAAAAGDALPAPIKEKRRTRPTTTAPATGSKPVIKKPSFK